MSNYAVIEACLLAVFGALSCFLIGGLIFELYRWLSTKWRKRG